MAEAKRSVAVLVGNGLSIAFNPKLNLRSITDEVLNRIQEADGEGVVRAMKEIAEHALPDGANSAEDFEALVGAFGSQTRTLGILSTLAELRLPLDTDLQQSIRDVANFAEVVRDNGISHVLEVIAERSRTDADGARPFRKVISAIIDSFDDQIAFGNLNYDTLLLALLMAVCEPELADLGHGWKTVQVEIDARRFSVPGLRSCASEFPQERRVRLLHLHGSITYWAEKDTKFYAKMPINLIEDGSQWTALRNQSTTLLPLVVLANQREKTEHVGQYPFSLAYEMFKEGLLRAQHWIVIGYSFRDEPVNKLFRDEFIDRDSKPNVLVVTCGDQPSRETVERAFGWGAEDRDSSGWLRINRRGVVGLDETPEWDSFVRSFK